MIFLVTENGNMGVIMYPSYLSSSAAACALARDAELHPCSFSRFQFAPSFTSHCPHVVLCFSCKHLYII